jgi:arylsulfatase B/arylsulfatase I/J
MLKKRNFATHMVGKWHLGFYKDEVLPWHRGFDSYYGYLTGSEDYYTHKRCDSLSYPDQQVCGLDLRNKMTPDWNETGKYSTHLFTEEAENIIEQHAASKTKQPLFLYLAFQAVHAPNQVPAEYLNPYKGIKQRRILAGMVSCLDEAVGNITRTLQAHGLWNNTILVFSTDNGGDVNENHGNNWPLRGWKHSLWDGGMRGVGVIHSPLLKKSGFIANQLMHVSDWFPTFVNLAGGNASSVSGLDGYDMWPAVTQNQSSPRQEILHNIDPLFGLRGNKMNHTYDIRVRSALRVGKYKIITGDPLNGSWVPPPEDEKRTIPDPDPWSKNLWLFNMEEDPLETTDLSSQLPDVVQAMLDKLVGYNAYNATVVPCRYPRDDPLANPEKHGGVYSPWM